MNLKNQPPVFVPEDFQPEMEKLSKAALMDMVWDYAKNYSASEEPAVVLKEFRERRKIILTYRQQAPVA